MASTSLIDSLRRRLQSIRVIFVTGPDTRTSLHVQHHTCARAGGSALASLQDAPSRRDGFPVVVRPCRPRTTHRLLSANPDGLVSSGPTRKTSTSPLPESGKEETTTSIFCLDHLNRRRILKKTLLVVNSLRQVGRGIPGWRSTNRAQAVQSARGCS